MTFLAFFYTDVYKIPAGTASVIIFVGGFFGAFLISLWSHRRPDKYPLGKIQTLDIMDVHTLRCDSHAWHSQHLISAKR